MPRIQQLQRRVTQIIGGDMRISMESPDTGIETRSLGEVGKTVSGIAEKSMELQSQRQVLLDKQQAERDKALAAKAYNEYLTIASGHDNELMNRTGFDSVNISSDMSKKIEPEYKRIAQALENDTQRYLFESNTASHALSRKNKYNDYERAELSKAAKKESESIIANASNFAIDNYQDQNALKKALSDIDIYTELALPGAGANVKKEFKDGVISDIHVGRVKAYLADDNIEGAIGYYKGVEDKILPEQRVTLKSNLDRNDTLEKAQRLVDAVALEFTTPEERKKQIRELSEGAEREAAMRIMNARIADDERLKQEQHDEFMAGKIRDIRSAPTLEAAFRIANTAQKAADKTTLEDIAQKFFDAKAKRVEKIETDPRVKDELRTAISNGTIDTPEKVFEYVSGKKITNKDITDSLDFLSKNGIVGDISYPKVKNIYKGLTGETPEDDSEKFNAIYDYVKSSISATGKSPTDTELRNLISTAVVEGEIESGIWWLPDEDMTYLEAVSRGKVNKWLPEITDDAERDSIKKSLSDLGYITDNDMAIKLYKKAEILNVPLTEEEKRRLRSILIKIGRMVKVKR